MSQRWCRCSPEYSGKWRHFPQSQRLCLCESQVWRYLMYLSACGCDLWRSFSMNLRACIKKHKDLKLEVPHVLGGMMNRYMSNESSMFNGFWNIIHTSQVTEIVTRATEFSQSKQCSNQVEIMSWWIDICNMTAKFSTFFVISSTQMTKVREQMIGWSVLN